MLIYVSFASKFHIIYSICLVPLQPQKVRTFETLPLISVTKVSVTKLVTKVIVPKIFCWHLVSQGLFILNCLIICHPTISSIPKFVEIFAYFDGITNLLLLKVFWQVDTYP